MSAGTAINWILNLGLRLISYSDPRQSKYSKASILFKKTGVFCQLCGRVPSMKAAITMPRAAAGIIRFRSHLWVIGIARRMPSMAEQTRELFLQLGLCGQPYL
jgi:hypothetical protein